MTPGTARAPRPERAPKLVPIEPVGGLEEEPRQEHGDDQARRHVDLAAQRQRRDDEPDDDEHCRVGQPQAIRNERDERHRGQERHEHEEQSRRERSRHRDIVGCPPGQRQPPGIRHQ
jgi:hypothetical protein